MIILTDEGISLPRVLERWRAERALTILPIPHTHVDDNAVANDPKMLV